MKEKSVYTTKEVSDLFSVSRVAVFKWIQSGKLRAQKIGRNYVIPVDTLVSFLSVRNERPTRKKEEGILKKLKLLPKLGLVNIPVFGSANCGIATNFADDHVQGYIRVSEKLVRIRDGVFAVIADGLSMNRAKVGSSKRNIEPGDYVIVNGKDKIPKNGDYVLSVIDGLANIKKFYLDQKHRQVMLVSESTKEYPPIIIDESEIDQYVLSGKVVEVIKNVKV